ncbi:MAG: hydroxymethylglutaryl-CoA lyase [Bdellovibrionales bacterium]|nr:hydroxymethylglutaryl-CoA lyase [Bdellovibrionales bacterium]
MINLKNNNIKLVEVGPRDGLQNETKLISLDIKLELIKKLIDAGLTNIEVGSFVSEKKVPSMKNTYELCVKLQSYLKNKKYSLSTLVPNLKGLEQALKAKVSEIAVFISCTETFSHKNINCSILESLDRVKNITEICKKNNIQVRAYISVVFGCPYEGNVLPQQSLDLIKKLLKLGVYEISLGDTIGIANPPQVKKLLELLKAEKINLSNIAMHFHDTQKLALDNILISLKQGIRIFDSSVGGLGGCPYADGATGNVATEDVIKLLESNSFKTDIDLQKIKDTAKFIKKYI